MALLVATLIIVGVQAALSNGHQPAPRAVPAGPAQPAPNAASAPAPASDPATPAPVGMTRPADDNGRPLIGADLPPQQGSPPLPPDVGPIAMTGNPRDAEPCALIDLSWLRQFGPITPKLPFLPSSCEVGIGDPDAQTLVRVDFESADPIPAGATSPEAGQVRRIGTSTIVHTVTSSLCKNRILLGGAQVVVVALSGQGLDRCAVTEVATNVALAALREHGVPYRPGRAAVWHNAAADVCTLLLPTDVAAAGIPRAVRKRGYANWVCAWLNGRTYVELDLNLAEAATVRWEPTTVDGRQAWLLRSSAGRPAECQVTVVTRPAPSPSDADEMLSVILSLNLPIDQVCTRARTVAAIAAARVPTG